MNIAIYVVTIGIISNVTGRDRASLPAYQRIAVTIPIGISIIDIFTSLINLAITVIILAIADFGLWLRCAASNPLAIPAGLLPCAACS